jgi:hypothetical protein
MPPRPVLIALVALLVAWILGAFSSSEKTPEVAAAAKNEANATKEIKHVEQEKKKVEVAQKQIAAKLNNKKKEPPSTTTDAEIRELEIVASEAAAKAAALEQESKEAEERRAQAKQDRLAAEAKAKQEAEAKAKAKRDAANSRPAPPTTPGCFLYSDSNCPNKSWHNKAGVWHHDVWGEENRGADKSEEACKTRAGSMDNWCGVEDTKKHVYQFNAVEETWEGHGWTAQDTEFINSGKKDEETCERHPGFKFKGAGKDDLYPGCGSAWCCKPKGAKPAKALDMGCGCAEYKGNAAPQHKGKKYCDLGYWYGKGTGWQEGFSGCNGDCDKDHVSGMDRCFKKK